MDINKSYKLNEIFLRRLTHEQKHALALLLLIKRKYANSRVYDYNPTSLSKRIGVSRYVVSKYTHIIKNMGWGYFTKAEFVVKSFKSIIRHKRHRRFEIIVEKDDTIKSLVDKINFIILENNIKIQKEISLSRSYYFTRKRKGQSLKHYKKIKKRFKPDRHSGAYVEKTILGVRKLSKILKCSLDYASKFIKRMAKRGLIKTEEIYELVKEKVSSSEYCSGFGYFYTYKNNLYVHFGTSISLA